MTAQLSVQADADAEAAGAVAAVVSSLPVSLKPADAAADLVAIAGYAGWTGRADAAIRHGAKGVVVINPQAEDPAALAAVAKEHGAAVVLDQQWAGNPVLAETQEDVRDLLAKNLADAVLVDSVAHAAAGSDAAALLTEHLAAILTCGVEVSGWKSVQRTPHGYVVAGRLSNGAPLVLHGVLTSAVPATAKVSILTASGRADVVLPDPSAAWPAEVRTVTADGATTLPSLYESTHRHSWTRLRDQLLSGTPGSDLEQFATLTSTVRRLTV
ncbi:hypothetical protein [Pseudarthrobacter raffinosi]|uniref:hypothetical protein n=1 Tax=Pseudarthrobacter raffinosi TaxID=2953651 RepID=UPI00208F376C|nr:hypothetical protein [Pseudarthrobacter sp. MDT3-28]MCO4239453.1 hypothetical protein [Pseudarthrobacter sp. MDT3-28]